MTRQILLDMDGVLDDWVSAVLRLFGLDPEKVLAEWPEDVYDISEVLIDHGFDPRDTPGGSELSDAEVLEATQVEMWRRVHAGGADFWADLEPLPWAHDIYDLCMSTARTTVLTSPSDDPLSLAGKVRWLDKHFPDRSYLIGPDKIACASPGSVLIDDRDSMCEHFAHYGGTSIVFPQPWNSARGITPRVEHVRQVLSALGHEPI